MPRATRSTCELPRRCEYCAFGAHPVGLCRSPSTKLAPVGQAQVTYLPIRDLPGPEPGTPRSEYTQAERVGQQIVRLIAMFATHLMSSERERLKLFSFDEGWRLLGDPVGRTLLASLQRMGRSELAVPIISTQLVTDALVGERESLENLLGATFVFGMRSELEASRALTLLGLDPEDRRARERLLEFEAGRCCSRSPRSSRGDPSRGGRAVSVAGLLHDPALLGTANRSPGVNAGPLRASRRLAFAFTLGLLVASSLCVKGDPALAGARRVPTPKPSAPRAPAGPALGAGGVTVGEASASAPSSGGDPLTGNGLDSPLCRASVGLSAAQRRSCETDNFVAAPDPTNDYAFDVNIDTGLGKWGNDMSATIDDFAQFGWMALVSATHGLVVMFEWCYSLNLLSGALLSQVSVALREARSGFTEPWLAFVLAVASMLVVYHGLVKRQVAETMGQAMAMVAMMGGGLWVIADPADTVGAVESGAIKRVSVAMASRPMERPQDPARTPPTIRRRSSPVRSTRRGVTWSSAMSAGAISLVVWTVRSGKRVWRSPRASSGRVDAGRAVRPARPPALASWPGAPSCWAKRGPTKNCFWPCPPTNPLAIRPPKKGRCSTCSAGVANRPTIAGARRHPRRNFAPRRERAPASSGCLPSGWGRWGCCCCWGFWGCGCWARQSPDCSSCCLRPPRCWPRRSAMEDARLFAAGL